jgi:nucleoside-diphosphate kinase
MEDAFSKSLVLVKPDGVARGLVGEVISAIEREGLKITELMMTRLDRERAEQFYAVHKGKDFYAPLIEYITSGPVVGIVVEGEDVLNRVREIMGATDPKEAKPGTIRAKYGENTRRNVVHGSDSEESFRREYEIIFDKEKLKVG